MGPNIYGFYYTPANLCATFCTAYDVKGHAALSSQSGGIGMAIIGFSRSAKMGVSAIVGLGNKSDIDEDDLLAFFEQDPNTNLIAQHCEDLKDGRAFAEAAKRVSKKKPVIVLKAGRTSAGAKAASSHTGALAGNDKIYEDVLKQSGVIRARSLRQLLEFARGVPVLPTPKGENILIITGAGGSGVLLSDSVVDNGMSLMAMPPDLDAAFRKFIPPFGAAGNPVDITGGEPPITYVNTVKLGLSDERIHALILGYWHTIVTPPMVFARNMVEVKKEMEAKGFVKPIVASLAGDVEVEEAAEYLYQNGIPSYAYSTELPVEVLGAKYKWARGAGRWNSRPGSTDQRECRPVFPGGIFFAIGTDRNSARRDDIRGKWNRNICSRWRLERHRQFTGGHDEQPSCRFADCRVAADVGRGLCSIHHCNRCCEWRQGGWRRCRPGRRGRRWHRGCGRRRRSRNSERGIFIDSGAASPRSWFVSASLWAGRCCGAR